MQYRKQVEKNDCAFSIIQVMYKYFFDDWISLTKIKSYANHSKDGISIFEFKRISNIFGMKAQTLKGDFESLIKIKLDKPIVSIIKEETFFHYVIIEKITSKNKIIYFDPVFGKRKVDFAEFCSIFTGVIIDLEINNENKQKKENTNKYFDIYKTKFDKNYFAIFIGYLVVTIVTFLSTFYLKIVLDNALPTGQITKLLILTSFFIFLIFIKMLLTSFINIFLLKREHKFKKDFLNLYISKLSQVKWIKIKHMDESVHIQNIDIIMKISSFKSKHIFVMTNEIFSLLVLSVFLLLINEKIFILLLISSSLSVCISFLFEKRFKKLEIDNLKNSIAFDDSTLNIFKNMVQYKLEATKQKLDSDFKKSFDKLIKTSQKIQSLNFFYSFSQTFLKNVIPFFLVIFIVIDTWKTNSSVGNIFVLISFANFFHLSFLSVSKTIIDLPTINLYIDNINAFLEFENENKNSELKTIDKITKIKINYINFLFDENDKALKVKNYSLKPKTKIIGKNGTGKSTLMKIISTLIVDQDISFNGKQISEYNLFSIREQICYVTNNEYFFKSSVFEYLCSKSLKSKDILIKNIEKYDLLTLFSKMGISLHTNIESFGKNLSIGQKQFISIMRVFASDYSVFLMDEVFENFDKKILEEIFEILRSYLKDKIVLETSHNGLYIFEGQELNCEHFQNFK